MKKLDHQFEYTNTKLNQNLNEIEIICKCNDAAYIDIKLQPLRSNEIDSSAKL